MHNFTHLAPATFASHSQISTPLLSDLTMVSVSSGMDVDRNRSSSPNSRTPNHSPRLGPSRLSSSRIRSSQSSSSCFSLWYRRKRTKVLLALISLLALFFFVNYVMLLRLQHQQQDLPHPLPKSSLRSSLSISIQVSFLIMPSSYINYGIDTCEISYGNCLLYIVRY